jgi:hypothetical protein
MSFERFSTSDVYIFEHVGGFIQCCGCIMGDDWDYSTPREMLAHLNKHEDAGHDIGKARARIIEEYPDLDVSIEPYVRSPEEEERIKSKLGAAFEQHPPEQFRDKANGE